MDTEENKNNAELNNLISEELKDCQVDQEPLIEHLDFRMFKAIKDLQVQVQKIQNDLYKQQIYKDEPINNLKLLINDFSLFDDVSLQKKVLDNILKLIYEKFTIIESRIKSLETTQDFLMEDVMNMTERVNKLTDRIELIEKELEKIRLVDLILMVKTFIEKQE